MPIRGFPPAKGAAWCLKLVLAALALTQPTNAQATLESSYDLAIAAGYKASVLCSSIFNANRSEPQIDALELTAIYPEYDALLPTLSAEIDRTAKMVRVAFDPLLPPRIAAWRPNLGCASLPIGASASGAKVLPRFDQAAPILDERPWPLGERGAAAKPHGNAAALAKAIDEAFDGTSFGEGTRTTSVVIIQKGKIVGERYAAGFGPHVSQRTWSVAKSITSTLVGIASYQGRLHLDEPAALQEWSDIGDPRAEITINQLLSMASGLHSDTAGNRTDAIYFGGSTVREFAPNWGLDAKPGTRFRYANNDSMLAAYTLAQRIGSRRMLAYPFTELLWKIGMTRTVPETDWKGDFVLSSQVWSTARDLARLGMLYLADGVWNGKRLFAADWRAQVSSRAGPQPDTDTGFGLGFWLLDQSTGVPADTFAAFGHRGQFVIIVPSRDIVLVRRGEDAFGKGFDPALFAAALLATLR